MFRIHLSTMKVSIIIPIYKVEPYIERCIQSVLRQTYRNLEVILVDDCTPDRSMELARACIEQSPLSKDLKFVFLQHEQNRGVSVARNTGIDAATGDYLMFIDSDDVLYNDCIEVMLSCYTKKAYDFVSGDLSIENKKLNPGFIGQKGAGEYNGRKEILRLYNEHLCPIIANNKLIRADFLRKNSLYFKEGIINEDILWTIETLMVANSIFLLRQPTYIYILHSNSISTTENSRIKTRYLWAIYQELRMYVSRKGLGHDKDVDTTMERFIRYIYAYASQAPDFNEYDFYKKVRLLDSRSIGEKSSLYIKGLTYFFKNIHYLLPTSAGWYYLKTIPRIKNFSYRIRKHIPSVLS